MLPNLPNERRRHTLVSVLIVTIAVVALIPACSKNTNEAETSRPRSEAVTPTSPLTDSGDSESSGVVSDGELGVGGQTTRDTYPENFPCSLVTDEKISELGGGAFSGRARTTRISEETVSFNAKECLWEQVDGEDASTTGTVTEIYLQVSEAADFRSGKVTCHLLPNATGTVDGLGEGAQWAWTTQNDADRLGKLRVCTTTALYTVAVSGPDDEARLEATATAVVEQAMGAA